MSNAVRKTGRRCPTAAHLVYGRVVRSGQGRKNDMFTSF